MNNILFKRKYILPIIVVLPIVFGTTGCANMPKATSISATGAIAGALIGAEKGGLAGAMVGAVIGGYVGNLIGAHLDEEDRKKLAILELEVLNGAKSRSFVTNKSKATITIIPEEEKIENVRTYTVSEDIKPYQLKMVESKEVTAFIETPVYSSLDEKTFVKKIINKGEIINIQANVESDSKWAAIIESDNVIGYIPVKYLNPRNLNALNKEKIAQNKTKNAVTGNKIKNNNVNPVVSKLANKSNNGKTDSVPTSTVAGLDVSNKKQDISSPGNRTIVAVGVCKTIKRTIDPGKGSESNTEKVKYCQEPPPKWKTITV